MLKAQSDIFATLKHDERVTRSLLDRINEVINRRTRYLLNETLMLAGKNLNDNYSMDFTCHLYPFMNCCCYLLSFSIAELMLFFLILMFFFFPIVAAALDPQSLYQQNFAKHHSAQFAVTMALKKVASSPTEASIAIDQYANIFCEKKLLFGSIEARSSALRGQTKAGSVLFLGQIRLHVFIVQSRIFLVRCSSMVDSIRRTVQRITKTCKTHCLTMHVIQWCERNWSTFGLVHTKLRNRLGYEKLHKLVYVHYNLKLSIQQFEIDFQNLQQHKEVDPCSMMMDVALFDEENPIMDWLSNSMTESAPILDEYDDYDDDWTTPGGFLIDELQMQPEEVAAFKRKLCFGRNGGQKKGKVGLDDEEEFVDDYESDSAHGSPVYAETGDSSSASEEDGDGEFLLA